MRNGERKGKGKTKKEKKKKGIIEGNESGENPKFGSMNIVTMEVRGNPWT